MVTVICPKCRETRTVAGSVGFTCKGCGARITVDSKGKITRCIQVKKK